MNKSLFCLFSLFIISSAFAQPVPSTNFPKGYFRDPLNIPISLAGNFGELRPNHYHMGLDIRTEKSENLPVFAAADGFIAKIKIEPAGFGQAIYINHPNGYTTVYAHLNAFFPALSEYVKQQQYKTESWKQFIDLPPSLFPVKKGDLIAYSGNTGGSQAPHLHFEIRNTKDDINLNPALFGLPIPDNIAPTISKLAIYNRLIGIYDQIPVIMPLIHIGSKYSLKHETITVASPSISFGISAYDKLPGATNQVGIYEAWLYHNGQVANGFRMNNIGYENTRNINAHIDYRTKAKGGPYIQQLFRLQGYSPSIYMGGDGVIDLSDGAVHAIRVEVKDVSQNLTVLEFKVQFKNPAPVAFSITGKKFSPNMLDVFETADLSFYIGEKSLFDSVRISYLKSSSNLPAAISAVHSIGEITIPLKDSFTVRIKPTLPISSDKKSKVVMLRMVGEKREVQKVTWIKDWASAGFREFGSFQLVIDESAPIITALGLKTGGKLSRANKLVISVKDNFDRYKNFRAELDGQWLRFSNDKGRNFIYLFDEHCSRGQHVLNISVEDEAGNIAKKSFSFIR